MDSCNDVFVLYSKFVENPMPLEEIFNHGTTDTIRFGIAVLCMQHVENAFRGHVAALPRTLYPGF